MLKTQVIDHFGSIQAAANALGITKSAVSQWKAKVPRGAAYIAQAITDGALKVDPAEYPPKKRSRQEA